MVRCAWQAAQLALAWAVAPQARGDGAVVTDAWERRPQHGGGSARCASRACTTGRRWAAPPRPALTSSSQALKKARVLPHVLAHVRCHRSGCAGERMCPLAATASP